jgi:hypothetical protein
MVSGLPAATKGAAKVGQETGRRRSENAGKDTDRVYRIGWRSQEQAARAMGMAFETERKSEGA